MSLNLIAKLIADFITNFIKNLRLKFLKKELAQKVKVVNEKKQISDKQYTDFKSAYDAFLSREEQLQATGRSRGNVRDQTELVQEPPDKGSTKSRSSARNYKRTKRSRRSKRNSNRGTK